MSVISRVLLHDGGPCIVSSFGYIEELQFPLRPRGLLPRALRKEQIEVFGVLLGVR